MAQVHASAVVEPGAKLGEAARIGPYCLVGPEVELADGVVLHSHVVVTGRTRVGPRTEIYPFASIGHPPQDLKYRGERSELAIGADNRIREHVTINPGTEGGGMLTSVGDRCLLMVGAHVAHDCRLGNGVIMANNATLGGHVVVGDQAIIGGLSAVHQFVRIGRNAMIGGMSGVEHDVIPFGLVLGDRAHLNGLNIVGLKRNGFARGEIQSLQQAYKAIFTGAGTIAERLEALKSEAGTAGAVDELVSFALAESSRALCQPKSDDGR
ncbi:MAG: acyl-ACP--UDP-N-acetylglucosamine O-acyltransferase [Kiloniellales bacterium]|nr:acyl-ACP--UDP-N-acetylglucosamine O-acyltransferase [Kiloniellales bacterium]